MPLRRENPLRDIYTLHASMVTGAPDMNFRPGGEEIGGGWRGHGDDVVEMHLMEADGVLRFGEGEEGLTEGRKLDGRVRELPVVVGVGLDAGAEGAAEDLVAEADACEADVGAMSIQIYRFKWSAVESCLCCWCTRRTYA
jgi:hypothetical protein